MYRYDLHCHTKEVSPCGNVSAAELVAAYKKAGYSGIVATDHVYESCMKKRRLFQPKKDFTDFFLEGYHALKSAAGSDFTVLLGMEIRFTENHNDYLVFGLTEEFLRSNGGLELCKLGIKKFSAFSHEAGLLVVQAHPFRKGLVRADPSLIDGAEVNNGNKRHNSHDDEAFQWAKENHLIMTSGSDYHEYEDLARGGIETEIKITTSRELIDVLKSGNYKIIKAD